jgi:tRNA (adenine22-N1)-methyltransferase
VRYYSPVLRANSRLGLVASQISPDAQVVLDVGYDHGQLLAHLAETRPELRLMGGEVSPQFKARFENHYGPTGADLRTGDGLSVATPGEVDVIVMAGLGDHTMRRLLEEGRDHLPHLRQVICCPPSLEVHLRPGLAALGLRITSETIAFKRHRSYDIIASEPGEVTEAPHPWGPTLISERHPEFLRHLTIQRHLFRRDFDTEMRSHLQPDGSLDLMGKKLALLGELIEQVKGWSTQQTA